MEELRDAHLKAGHPKSPKYHSSGLTDQRLSLFSYSTETIHMLLLPMVNNKYANLKEIEFR